MKKYIWIAGLWVLSLQSCKQEVSYDQLPKEVKTSFAAQIPHAYEVKWEENPDYYFAYFTENGQEGMALFYKADGHWIETDKALSINELSLEQRKRLLAYKNSHIERLAEIRKNDSTDIIKAEVIK
ncbi:MAG: hypothetical protein U0X91_21515 [Spirosomataceae bacterium]